MGALFVLFWLLPVSPRPKQPAAAPCVEPDAGPDWLPIPYWPDGGALKYRDGGYKHVRWAAYYQRRSRCVPVYTWPGFKSPPVRTLVSDPGDGGLPYAHKVARY